MRDKTSGDRLAGAGDRLAGAAAGGPTPGKRTRIPPRPAKVSGAAAVEVADEPGRGSEHELPPAQDQLDPAALSEDERRLIIDETEERLGAAFAAFSAACGKEREAVRRAAEGGGIDVFEILFDVAIGLLLPGLSHSLQRLVNQIPAISSETAHRLRLALESKGAELAFEMGTENALHQAKQSVAESKTTEVDAFITHLAVQFQIANQRIREDLRGMPTAVIAATCAAFDARVTNQATYEVAVAGLIQRFRSTVEPIGRARDGSRGSGDWRVEWTDTMMACEITDGAALRAMGLVERRERADTGERRHRLVRWIPPELHEVARGKVRALTGGEMGTLSISQVEMDAW